MDLLKAHRRGGPRGGKPLDVESGSKRLAQYVFFKVLNQERDSVRIDPGFAPVVAGSESVGVVCLVNKGAVGLGEFLYGRLHRKKLGR